MEFKNFISQKLKKSFPPSGKIYKSIRLMYQYMASFKRLKKKHELVFNTHVTDHCNLNCACCNQFSPLLNDGFRSVDVFKKDCARLFELGGERIAKIVFSGGEPLLHPQVTDFFDAARDCFDKYRGHNSRGGGGGNMVHNERHIAA